MSASDLYPLSSPQGDAIPLEIVKPLGLAVFSFGVNTPALITIPAEFNLCWLYATQDCVLQVGTSVNLPGALVAGADYSKAVFVPAKTPVCLQLAGGSASLLGLDTAGKLYINNVQQWAGLALNKQSSYS